MDSVERTRHRTRLLRLVTGVLAALLLVMGIVLWGATQELSNLHRGFSEGFELRGTHDALEQPSGRYYRATFGYGERTWQMDWFGRDIVEGTYRETADPNHYQLHDAEGDEVGWVHVAYVSGKDQGIAYVQYNGETLELEKRSHIPEIEEIPERL